MRSAVQMRPPTGAAATQQDAVQEVILFALPECK